jgi:hypothetical protein
LETLEERQLHHVGVSTSRRYSGVPTKARQRALSLGKKLGRGTSVNSDIGITHQVFMIRDTRLDEPKSVVYVGVTQQSDLNRVAQEVFKKRFPKLGAELLQQGLRADVQRRGARTDKTTAAQLKAELIAKYSASGSTIEHAARGGAMPFTISDHNGAAA